jgi:hypothetical protein
MLPLFKSVRSGMDSIRGNKCYTDMAELKADYSSGALHPGECYVTCQHSDC